MRSLANIDKDLDRNNFKIGQQITSLRTIVGMEKAFKARYDTPIVMLF